ncbi:monovalent cation:proton antiporter-2 (CPA2) family protein [Parvibaculum sp.]|uniref:monovalent cation:proton antiporter-2 (CPA2) family protein n=1 Tax=Parvibaculum sp. TaxID=2024848 RepID=UPI0025EB4F5F|nr:monovalent cation:proton antiporter-2 (CPA2) family protein [Parvibaculum sp.]
MTAVPLPPPHEGAALLAPIIFLAAAVIAVPIFRRLKLGSVVGYLAAGIVIGPTGLGLFSDADAVLALAELGIVMLLFIIGLELKPSRLWSMRKDIFGFGLAQIVLCGAALAGLAHLSGLGWRAAVVAGSGLALSSTAFAAPLMEERNELTQPYGQRAFAILLMQDLAIVPLLALVALIAPGEHAPTGGWTQTLGILAAVAAVVLSARYLLNPLFRVLANAQAHEIMTAAALLVVLGAAFIMQAAGLSMAMGAFLAGVLLAESSFRHELEADVEPFRGLLLGLFFIAIGMGIDLKLVAEHGLFIACAVLVLMAVKALVIYGLSRLSGSVHADAVRIAGVLAQGGEFAFVLFGAAATAGIMSPVNSNLLIATVTVSLALTPLAFAIANRLAQRKAVAEIMEMDFSDAKGRVVIIGFGRFGQVVAQFLLSQGIEVTAIEHDVEQIRAASRFGFRVYYGDGTRLDVLRAAGAADASLIALCVVKRDVSAKIVDLVQMHFPLAKLYVRSYDRRQSLELLRKNVDFQIRETYESAVAFGVAALEALGFTRDQADEVEEDIRRRDAERLALQLAEGEMAGQTLMHTQAVIPEPLTQPKRTAQALNQEAEDATKKDDPVDADAQA